MKTKAIANTKYGKLEGVCIDGVYRFLGVHYAQDTSGKNRFMPPQPLEPWEGAKPALEHVAKCWQTDTPRMEAKEVTGTEIFARQQKLMVGSSEMGVGRQTEDCLAVNIWTNGLKDGRKRPVMVWLHGGGNIAGAAEADWHDGYDLARVQDVVVVNVGHRLGIFGYLYLGELSEKYRNSANLGNQDMVAALQWIHDNIEEFGGDPDNVTIFGQSGGGGKVMTLMGMPSADGLFHKAIIQSGGMRCSKPSESTEQTKAFLEYLNIDVKDIDKLQEIPPEDLIKAQRAINATREEDHYFMPPVIMDGEVFRYDPFDGAEGSERVKNMPVMTGFTKDDASLRAVMRPWILDYTFETLPKAIGELGYTPEKTGEIIAYYKDLLGDQATAPYVYICLLNDINNHLNVVKRAIAREKVGSVDTFLFVFSFETPDPDLKAVHGVDVPFFFDAAIYAPGLWNVDTRVGAMKLSKDAAAAWASFARTGNPSCANIGVWKPYTGKDHYIMSLDVESRLLKDYHAKGLTFGEIG